MAYDAGVVVSVSAGTVAHTTTDHEGDYHMTYTVDIRKAIKIDDNVLAALDCDHIHLGRVDESGSVELEIHMVAPDHDKLLALSNYLTSITC